MNKHEFAGMCIRLLGLFFVVTGLYQVPSLLLPWLKQGHYGPPTSYLLAAIAMKILLPLLAGLLVWICSSYLAGFIAGPVDGTEMDQNVISVGASDFLATALVVTGLVFLFSSLEKLLYSFLTYTVQSGPHQEARFSIGSRVLPDNELSQITWVIICLLSVLLIFRAEPLSRRVLGQTDHPE
jgi:hypothetical protein